MPSFVLQNFDSRVAYRELMLAAFSLAHSCSLVVRDQLSVDEKAIGLIDRLQNSLMRFERVSKWPGTELLGHMADLYTYRLDAFVSAELLHAANRFGDWRVPSLPEDPALYRIDGTLLMGSIIHEKDVYLDLTRAEHGTITASAPNAKLVEERTV